MSKHKPLAGTDLGKAVCKHFGLNPNHVDVVSQIDFRPQAMASIKLTIMLTAEDLAGIAQAAGAETACVDKAAADFYRANQDAAAGFSPEASDTLRRYGCYAQRSEPGPELIRFGQPYSLIKGESLIDTVSELKGFDAFREPNVQTVLRD